MEGMGIILTIIVGALAGWIAEKIMRADHGLLTNIILGIVGALVGNGLMRLFLDGTFYGIWGQLIVAIIGACVVIGGWRMLRGRPAR